MGKSVPRTIEFIADTSSLEFVKTSGTQEVYECPWCETKYGPSKSGRYPKLYIDPDKGVGICYRCNTVVIVGDRDDPRRKLAKLEEGDLSSIERVPLPAIEPVRETLDSLIQRSPYLQELDLGSLAIGEVFLSGEKKVIFPFLVDGEPFGYQIWLRRENMKYYTYPAPKIPYSPTGIDTSRKYDTVTLVEGVFDALGALWLGYPNPMAVLGLSLSNLEINILKSMGVKRVCVFLDETRLSAQVALDIVEKMGIKASIIKSKGTDPDEKAGNVYRTLKEQGYPEVRPLLRKKCQYEDSQGS